MLPEAAQHSARKEEALNGKTKKMEVMLNLPKSDDSAAAAAATAAAAANAVHTEDNSGSEEGDEHHPSFQVGLENSSERLHELQFSLVHHVAATNRSNTPLVSVDLEDDLVRIPVDSEVEEPPRRIDTDLIAAEIEAFASHEQNLLQEEELVGEDKDDCGVIISGIIPIQRMDSRDVVFDNRQKRAKVLAGKYVMGDVLGEGAFAKVKEAIDKDTLCRRAVKIMKRKKLRKVPHGEENVKGEIALMQRLRHRNVMCLVEVLHNDEKGKIYLVLEYCCAVLKDMLDGSHGGRFPAWQAHFYFSQLTDGLEYLHNTARVVHKDIKPANLLLDTAGVLKIADFGTAEQLDPFAADDICTSSQGTPAFQPPEVAAPDSTSGSSADSASSFSGFKLDVWSSGVTLFNFVTGDYPFSGDTIFRLFEDIARCEYDVPKDLVDPVLESLIHGMLTKNPSERLSLLDVRSHDWMRKKHPCSSPPVTVRPRDGDPTLSTTVIPYLCDLHYGSQLLKEANSQLEFVTEHQLHEMQQQRGEGGEEDEEGEAGEKGKEDFESRASLAARKAEKTTRCIKVRKISGCVIS